MNDNNTFCIATLMQIRQSFQWQFSMALIILIGINGVVINAIFMFIVTTASQFDTVSKHLLVLCSSSMTVGCVFRFITIIQLHNSFTGQSECETVLNKPMECLTGFHFMNNLVVMINFYFYLGVLIERIVVTLRTWRHPNEYAQENDNHRYALKVASGVMAWSIFMVCMQPLNRYFVPDTTNRRMILCTVFGASAQPYATILQSNIFALEGVYVAGFAFLQIANKKIYERFVGAGVHQSLSTRTVLKRNLDICKMHMASAFGHFLIYVPIPFIATYLRSDVVDPLNPYAYLYSSTTGAVVLAMLNLLITNVHPLVCIMFCRTIRLRIFDYFKLLLCLKKVNSVAPIVAQTTNRTLKHVLGAKGEIEMENKLTGEAHFIGTTQIGRAYMQSLADQWNKK